MSVSSIGSRLEEIFLSSKKRLLGSFAAVILLLSIPITLSLVSKEQDIRQRAAEVCTNVPTDIVLVVDKSGSMRNDNAMSHLKQAAVNFVDIVSADINNRIGVVSFASFFRTSLDSELSSDFSSIKSKINSIITGGETCIQCGIKKANDEITAKKRNGVKNVIILLTDGRANNILDNHFRVGFQAASDAATAEVKNGFDQNGTVFFTIGLGKQIQTDFLQEIANSTGGKYFFAPSGADLSSIYNQISQIVGIGAISGFVYNDANANGEQDTLEEKLPGWQIALKKSDQAAGNMMTDQSGGFSFAGICDAQYSVTLSSQAEWTITTPTNGTHSVTITNGNAHTDKNFGVTSAAQVIPTPTAEPTSIPTPEPTAEPTLEPTSTPTNTPTPDPTGTLTPTPTSSSSNSKLLNLKIFVPGIGGTAEGNNQSPINPKKTFDVEIYDGNNNLIKSVTGDLEFEKELSGSSGKGHKGQLNLGEITAGGYRVKVKTHNSLWRQIPGFVQLQDSTSSTQHELTLVTGDLNQDNKMGVEDYNLFISCYQNLTNCAGDLKISSDFNDDEVIDNKDLNVLLRAFANREGD